MAFAQVFRLYFLVFAMQTFALLSALWVGSALALPMCQTVFTAPASGNHSLNSNVPSSVAFRGNIQCKDRSDCFTPQHFSGIQGQYSYGRGHFVRASIAVNGPTVLYFDSLNLKNTFVNSSGKARNLVIYVRGDLTLDDHSTIQGIIYVGGRIIVDSTSHIIGGLSSAEPLAPSLHTQVEVQPSEIAAAQLASVCMASVPFGMQFGQASGNEVTFRQPFPAGTKPLVFLMPRIESGEFSSSRSTAAFVTHVDENGFSFQARNPGSSSSLTKIAPVDWIAMLPGRYQLDGVTGTITIQAGIRLIDDIGLDDDSRSSWVSVPQRQSIILTQLQTHHNQCWLTGYGRRSDFAPDQLQLGMISMPGMICPQREIDDETVAYLAVSPGRGEFRQAGGRVKFQFGQGKTSDSWYPTSMAAQCNNVTDFARDWFYTPPIVVAGTVQDAPDQTWLRRCQLTRSGVSMVVDGQLAWFGYPKQKDYGYLAVAQDNSPDLNCLPKEHFSEQHLNNNWIAEQLPGSYPPEINNGRMVLTRDIGDQAASITYRRLFPSAGNIIQVSFDYYSWHRSWDKGADGMALVFSDAALSPAPGGFGGSLGYAQRRRDGDDLPGFNGGWLGIALDEWGNFSSTEAQKNGGPGSRPQSIAMRGAVATRYRYIPAVRDGWPDSPKVSPPLDRTHASVPGPGDTYVMTLDTRKPGASIVSVDRIVRATGERQQIIHQRNISADLPGQRWRPRDFYVSITGSTGGEQNTHAIDNFQVCSLKSKPEGKQIHHFEFDYSGSPLACAPLAVTIKACNNASCSQLFTDPVDAVLTPASNGSVGWTSQGRPLPHNRLTLNNGQASAMLHQFGSREADKVILGVSSSIPTTQPYADTVCKQNGVVGSCRLQFAEAGFIISDAKTYAGKPVTMTLQAVRKSNNALQCQPAFANKTKLLTMGLSTRQGHPSAIAAHIHQHGQSVALSEDSGGHTVPVTFDEKGQATLELTYADAGWVQLLAHYQGHPSSQDAGLVMDSVNGNLRSVPAGFCIQPETAGVCRHSDAMQCHAYRTAGSGFPLTVSARAWQSDTDLQFCDNPLTPGFTMDNIKLGHSLVAPRGGKLGSLGGVSHKMMQGQTSFNQSVSEVGVFRFSAANPVDGHGQPIFYLNAGLPIASGWSAPVGRFVPALYQVNQAQITPACKTGFSYMGQPFTVSYAVQALNESHQITRNYSGQFARGEASLVAENQNDGTSLSGRLTPLPALQWQQGESYVSGAVTFNRLVAPNVDGPFNALNIGVAMADNDGSYTRLADMDMDPNHVGICGTAGTPCNAKQLRPQQKMLFGRVRMDNAYGPEKQNLATPVYAQYWDGAQWQVNQLDQCTRLNEAALSPTQTQYLPPLRSGQAISRAVYHDKKVMQNGQLQLLWHNQFAPVQRPPYQFYRGEVTAPLSVPSWLKFYWRWRGASPTANSDPRSSAYFGRYRGNDHLIYWRELY